MKKLIQIEAIPIGFAMFSMFFGAGNIIFPLAIGQYAGDQNSLAMLGLMITAVLVPFAGVLAMILYRGNYQTFFGRMGKTPGFLIALTIITLLGPIGSTPRCIALSFTSLSKVFTGISASVFSGLACLIIFLFTVRKNHILTLLGWVLTPLLLISLAIIVVLGLQTSASAPINVQDGITIFFHGLKEGYNTMDLLAAFFFSSTILSLLKTRVPPDNAQHATHPIRLLLQASMIGAMLLTIVYLGFSFISSIHSTELVVNSKDELLSAIILKVAGPSAGMLVCIAIGLACLTTAIALISVFTDFIQKQVFHEKVRYEIILIASLLLTFAISTLQFSGISAFLGPILQICYPGLIVLTALNIMHHWTGFTPVKLPVFLTFIASAVIYFC